MSDEDKGSYPAKSAHRPRLTGLGESEIQKKNKERWRYNLKVFGALNNSVNVKPTRASMPWEIISKRRRTPFCASLSRLNCTRGESGYLFSKKSTENVSNKLHKSKSKKQTQEGCAKENLSKSEIVWSSNDESDDGVKKPSRQPCGSLNLSYVSEGESEIVWSSSNESDDVDETSGRNNKASTSKIWMDPENELSLFVAAIEKDLLQTSKIKHLMGTKKDGLLNQSLAAIRKAKADRTFLEYENRVGILKGVNAVILEVVQLYGICTVHVKVEDDTRCCFLLYKCSQSVEVGRSLKSFVDSSKNYVINGVDIFVQPNKVVEI